MSYILKGYKMPKKRSVSTKLTFSAQKKSCVLFRSEESNEQVTTSCYLQNSAFEDLGKPKTITVTVAPTS